MMNIMTDSLLSPKNGSTGSGAADPDGADIVRSARADGLGVEMIGSRLLLPHGQKCWIAFAGACVTVGLGMRDFGHGYASPYFASVAVGRLGIPFNRIRLYYMGVHPAVKIAHWNVANIPSRASVGPANAQIGDLIEALCDRVIEQGRRFLSASIGVCPGEIDFESSTGRFSIVGKNRYVEILELAEWARCGGSHSEGLVPRITGPVHINAN